MEEAKQNPRDVMLASMHRSMNYKSFRIESIYKERFQSSDDFITHTEIIEYLLFPNKSDRWYSKSIRDSSSASKAHTENEKILIDRKAYERSTLNEGWKEASNAHISYWRELEDYLVLGGWDKEVRKTDVKFVSEESLDGVICAVFEYVAPGPNVKKNSKQRAWVGVSDGLFRKILIEGKDEYLEGEKAKASELITFSYDDKNMKIEPPI